MPELMEWLRERASQVIAQCYPEELPLFERFWPALSDEILRWKGKPPGGRALGRYRRRARSLLGPDIRLRGPRVMIPTVVGILVASVLELVSKECRDWDEIQRVVNRQALQFGLGETDPARGQEVATAIARLVYAQMQELEGVRAEPLAGVSGAFVLITPTGRKPVAERELQKAREQSRRRCRVFADLTQQKLYVDGRIVEIQRTPLQCLTWLMTHEGRICTYDELWKRCSRAADAPGASASRTAVRQWVSKILQACGWKRGYPIKNHKYIGYSWIADWDYAVLRP